MRASTLTPKADTRELLLMAAQKVFADKGYEGATVKELADAAGVNVSLVSYYFESKEGLYRTCLEQFGRERLAAAERVLKPAESPEDFRVRLRLFVEEVLYSHTEQAELSMIVQREHNADLSPIRELWRNVFGKIFLTLFGFVAHAQKTGLIRADIDPHATCVLFFGSLMNLSRVDTLHNELYGKTLSDPIYREQIANDAIKVFLTGALTQSAAR